jgi:hypothetical protein
VVTDMDEDSERRWRTSSVSWRTLGSSGPTWQSEEGTAGLARAAGKGVERRVDRGTELQALGGGRRQKTRVRGRENRGARGLEEEDRGPSCEKQKTQGPYCKAWTTFTPLLK